MQALLRFPAPTPELSEELAHRLIKGLVKKYRGGGGGGPEHLEMWLIKNT